MIEKIKKKQLYVLVARQEVQGDKFVQVKAVHAADDPEPQQVPGGGESERRKLERWRESLES